MPGYDIEESVDRAFMRLFGYEVTLTETDALAYRLSMWYDDDDDATRKSSRAGE